MQWGKTFKSRQVRIAALSAVALVLVSVGGFAGHRAVAAHQAVAAGCERVTAWKQQNSPYQAVADGDKTIAVLGDSYSAGDDLTDRTDGWVYALGAQTGDRIIVNSVGYTGYTAGGYCGTDQFSTRIDTLTAAHPDTLIIQGGLNDVGADGKSIKTAAADLIRKTRTVPNVVLVGPPHAPQRASGEKAVDDALRSVARDTGVRYVSSYEWDLDYNGQGLHLTAAGHRQFAQHVAAELDAQ